MTRPPILCLGESMMLLTADQGGLRAASHLGVHVGGAESNVASGLAHLGHSVEWWSRLGRDPFGNVVQEFLQGRGVETGFVERDPSRPTGIYFKDREGGSEHVYYYRAGSAASAMHSGNQGRLNLEGRTLCHLSGITAALSVDASELMQRLVIDREPGGPVISFDVNFRARLWSAAEAAPCLLELASAADIVVVGRDEAEALWGTLTADEIRGLLPQPGRLVVKDADIGATCYLGSTTVFVPALRTSVVDAVGAGDAFAAGFLSGYVRDFSVKRALRLGHLMAALTLQDVSDLPALPAAETIVSISSMDDDEWASAEIIPRHLQDLVSLSRKDW